MFEADMPVSPFSKGEEEILLSPPFLKGETGGFIFTIFLNPEALICMVHLIVPGHSRFGARCPPAQYVNN